MRLFLIRHAETEHNVAGLLAGSSDSRLTNHGVLQTQRLAKHLVTDRGIQFYKILASDLSRACLTATEIAKLHNSSVESHEKLEVETMKILREIDFGSLELVKWSTRHEQGQGNSKASNSADRNFVPKESTESVTNRANLFIEQHIHPLMTASLSGNKDIAIVSHGLFLAALWRSLLSQFASHSITLGTDVGPLSIGRTLDRLPSWSNTGYLELEVTSIAPENRKLPREELGVNQDTDTRLFTSMKLTVQAINSTDHLSRLKRTRGGVGSATHDQRQRTLNSFFKKPKLDTAAKKGVSRTGQGDTDDAADPTSRSLPNLPAEINKIDFTTAKTKQI